MVLSAAAARNLFYIGHTSQVGNTASSSECRGGVVAGGGSEPHGAYLQGRCWRHARTADTVKRLRPSSIDFSRTPSWTSRGRTLHQRAVQP